MLPVPRLAGSDYTRYLVAGALQALALDDPTTTLDNGHQVGAWAAASLPQEAVSQCTCPPPPSAQAAICQSGAVPLLVAMLKKGANAKAAGRTEGIFELLQTSAAGALGTLAESELCKRLIVQSGAIEPLVAIAMFGSDQMKLTAIGALDVLQFNSADVKAQAQRAGAQSLLKGLTQYGSDVLRESAADVLDGLNAQAVQLSQEERVRGVKELRMRNQERREQLMEQARVMYGGVQTPFKVTNPDARSQTTEYLIAP